MKDREKTPRMPKLWEALLVLGLLVAVLAEAAHLLLLYTPD